MNRTVVSGVAAFALLVGAALAMTETTAEAGHCGGGLFSRLHARNCGGGLFSGGGCGGGGHLFNKGCGGGLLARLRAKHAARCSAPEPVCCEPAAVECAPACDSGCGASTDCGSGCGASTDCGSGCGASTDCGSGCGGTVMSGGCEGGCAGEVIMMPAAEGEVVAPESHSHSDAAPVEAAPPAPAPDAQTDA